MTAFIEPKGINFSCLEEISIHELSKILVQTVSFIQQIDSSIELQRYDDWWEHDGLHFYRGNIKFDDLFELVSSTDNLLEEMSGDFDVFIGIAPAECLWYLRFYLDSEESIENIKGRFYITFPNELALKFKTEILYPSNLKFKEQDSEEYYKSIIST